MIQFTHLISLFFICLHYTKIKIPLEQGSLFYSLLYSKHIEKSWSYSTHLIKIHQGNEWVSLNEVIDFLNMHFRIHNYISVLSLEIVILGGSILILVMLLLKNYLEFLDLWINRYVRNQSCYLIVIFYFSV